jgi:peptide subunit release factor 1 (eRF1)
MTTYNTLPVKSFGRVEEQGVEEFCNTYTYTLNSLYNQTWRIKNDYLRSDVEGKLEQLQKDLQQVTEDIFNELVLQRNGVNTQEL